MYGQVWRKSPLGAAKQFKDQTQISFYFQARIEDKYWPISYLSAEGASF